MFTFLCCFSERGLTGKCLHCEDSFLCSDAFIEDSAVSMFNPSAGSGSGPGMEKMMVTLTKLDFTLLRVYIQTEKGQKQVSKQLIRGASLTAACPLGME